MNLPQISGIIAGMLFAVSTGWYAVDVAKHKVTPSIATFFTLTILNASQLASLLSKHVWYQVPFTAVGMAVSLFVCLLALRSKKFYFALPDKLGLIGAAIGFVLWIVTRNATVNLYAITVVNIMAFLPLIIKSFRHPDLESAAPWRLNLLSSALLLLTINSGAVVVWIVPARQFLCSLLLNVGLLRGHLQKHQDQKKAVGLRPIPES